MGFIYVTDFHLRMGTNSDHVLGYSASYAIYHGLERYKAGLEFTETQLLAVLCWVSLSLYPAYSTEIESIEPYGDAGKYKLNFKNPAKSLDHPIIFGKAKQGTLQSPRYTSYEKLISAKELKELFD